MKTARFSAREIVKATVHQALEANDVPSLQAGLRAAQQQLAEAQRAVSAAMGEDFPGISVMVRSIGEKDGQPILNIYVNCDYDTVRVETLGPTLGPEADKAIAAFSKAHAKLLSIAGKARKHKAKLLDSLGAGYEPVVICDGGAINHKIPNTFGIKFGGENIEYVPKANVLRLAVEFTACKKRVEEATAKLNAAHDRRRIPEAKIVADIWSKLVLDGIGKDLDAADLVNKVREMISSYMQ